MDSLEVYNRRLKELEEDPLVREYAYIRRLINLVNTKAYNVRVNSPKTVIPERLTKLDKVEKDEENEVLKLLRWAGRASTLNDLNKFYKEFYFEDKDLKYKIRHQFKKGNLIILSYNDSRKYSFYIVPEWYKNGKIEKIFYPSKKDIPLKVESMKLKSYDGKIDVKL